MGLLSTLLILSPVNISRPRLLAIKSPTCCTEAASAQGSFPFVSSLGVSLGGLYFIAAPPAWLELEEVQMILFFLSLFTAILPALSHLSPPHVISWPDYQATLTGQQPLPSPAVTASCSLLLLLLLLPSQAAFWPDLTSLLPYCQEGILFTLLTTPLSSSTINWFQSDQRSQSKQSFNINWQGRRPD